MTSDLHRAAVLLRGAGQLWVEGFAATRDQWRAVELEGGPDAEEASWRAVEAQRGMDEAVAFTVAARDLLAAQDEAEAMAVLVRVRSLGRRLAARVL